MTEEQPEPRITNTQKEKDPRKVDAGKKLGAISKMAKKQKSLREANAVSRAEGEGEAQNLENNNNSNSSAFFYAGFAAVVVVGCLGIIYFTKQQPKQDPPEAPVVPKFRSNLISLDD